MRAEKELQALPSCTNVESISRATGRQLLMLPFDLNGAPVKQFDATGRRKPWYFGLATTTSSWGDFERAGASVVREGGVIVKQFWILAQAVGSCCS